MPIYWNNKDENIPHYEYDYIYGAQVLRRPDSAQPPTDELEHQESDSAYGQRSDDE